jgi:hypothetical protein
MTFRVLCTVIFSMVFSAMPGCLHAADVPASDAGAAISDPSPKTAERFSPRGDGTVFDTKTNLLWVKDANVAKSRMYLQAAKDYIKGMNEGAYGNYGYTDWRLPTVNELKSLLDTGRFYPALPEGHMFANVQNSFYWTGSGGFNIVGYIWMVDLASGNIKYDYVSYCSFNYLWPVRGTPINLPAVDEQVRPSDLDLSIGALTCEDSVRPPMPPGRVSATSVSASEIVLSWDKSDPSEKVAWYNVYRDNAFVKSSPEARVSFSGLDTGSEACFTVTSFNEAGVESKQSEKTCARTWSEDASNTVWSSGLNQFGQLGDGTHDDSQNLALAPGVSNVTKIAAGVEHVVALTDDGTVYTWGRNQRGQLGDGSVEDRQRPVEVRGLGDVIDVSAGWYHTLALTRDGTVWAWGRNYYGQLGNGGTADSLVPVKASIAGRAKSIAAGWYHSLAVLQDGTVTAWGWNLKGQLGFEGDVVFSPTPIPGLGGVDKVAAGMYHSLALRTDGQVQSWGWNEYGQLGIGSTRDSTLPAFVEGLKDVIDIDGGMHHSLAVRKDGKVLAWGRNEYGQVGVPGSTQYIKPMVVPSLDGAKDVEAGAHHSLALRSDGSVWLWGWNFAIGKKGVPPTRLAVFTSSGMGAGLHFTNIIKKD